MADILSTKVLNDMIAATKTALAGEPADGAALITALTTVLDNTVVNAALKQTLEMYKQTETASGGIITGAAITGGGTGYEVGDTFPVTGATSGTGGAVRVTSVAGGVIDGVEVLSVGDSYVGALTVDATGSGNGDAVLTATASYDQEAIINEAIAAL